jgi:lipoprotein NlpI
MADFNKALEIDPLISEAYYNRGLVWYYKGEFQQALADIKIAIMINGGDRGI